MIVIVLRACVIVLIICVIVLSLIVIVLTSCVIVLGIVIVLIMNIGVRIVRVSRCIVVVHGAWCGCVAWGSVVSIIIIIVVVIVSIIIIISCIVGVMDGAVLCRWMHRSGGCWFFRGYSRHPRVGFFYYRGGEDVRVAEVL